jgi:hypothetical protein
MSKKRAEKSEDWSLIKKRRLAIISGEKLHLSNSSSDSNKKEPTKHHSQYGQDSYNNRGHHRDSVSRAHRRKG